MNFPSVSQLSIAKGSGGNKPPEVYLPLYVWSGYSTYVTNIAQPSSPGTTATAVSKGIGGRTTAIGSSNILHTLNSNWSPSLQYALEISMCTTNSSSPCGAQLIDITANTFVSGSLVTTTSTTFTVVRSGTFTLIPGHQYGLMSYCASASGYITDGFLIVFPQ